MRLFVVNSASGGGSDRQQLADDMPAHALLIGADSLVGRLSRDTGFLQGKLVSPQAVMPSRLGLLPGDHGDASIAVGDQVRHCFFAGRHVVDYHGVHRVEVRSAVDRDHGNAAIEEELQRCMSLVRGHDDGAGYVLGAQCLDEPALASSVLGRIAEGYQKPFLQGNVLDATRHLHKEGVLHVGDQETDKRGSMAGEHARGPVRLIAAARRRRSEPARPARDRRSWRRSGHATPWRSTRRPAKRPR